MSTSRHNSRRRTPTKKARFSSDALGQEASPIAIQEVSRSDMFWYEDGDTILQTNDGTQFRVHTFILKLNSCVFRDMFETVAFSQERLIDGCPIVNVQDQKAEWHTMLSVLYKPTEMYPDHRDLTATALLSMLRLSRKYQFDVILQRALYRLSSEFPMTLESYDLIYENYNQCSRERIPACFCKSTVCNLRDLVSIINYAMEWNIQSILPVAYYLACTELSITDIMHGIPDGELKKRKLHSQNQHALIKGRDALRTDLLAVWFPWLSGCTTYSDAILPSMSCTNHCKDIRVDRIDAEFMGRMCRFLAVMSSKQQLPPSDIIRNYGRDDRVHEDMRSFLCASCLIMLQKHYDSSRKQIFKSFPSYFSLEFWACLQQDAKRDN